MAALKENPAHGGSRGQADISKHFALDRTVPTLRLLPLLEAIWGRGRGKARDTVALADAMHAILDETPALVGTGSGAGNHNQITSVFTTPGWRHWATNASVERISARQRRAVTVMATGLPTTPEGALKVRYGRL